MNSFATDTSIASDSVHLQRSLNILPPSPVLSYTDDGPLVANSLLSELIGAMLYVIPTIGLPHVVSSYFALHM